MSEIMVDILCLAYNHEKYIRQTLDGFVSQKTNFKFRVLIHDDASTDNTANIIKEYEEKYPDIICPIYQTENQYSKKIGIASTFLLPKSTAKYVAYCEGDDYWHDENKLQLQVDALEANSDCYLCVHATRFIYEDGTPMNKVVPVKYQQMSKGVIKSYDFIAMKWSFQLSSYVIRAKEYKQYLKNPPEFKKVCDAGDGALLLYFGQLGNVYYVDRVMSSYRKGVPMSWTAKNTDNIFSANYSKHYRSMFETYRLFNEYTNNVYHSALYSRMVSLLFKTLITEKRAKEYFKKEFRMYFQSLGLKKKGFVLFAILFPSLADSRYRKQILKKRKGA